ncbi:Receptor-like protein kinase FERONIA [Morella rubra]|uniref:Receptor-like protein kinase FERONIA n=1 Tax=Morella rubra TaxID=262757 RepID=A0A6A1UMV9_9ROSI|nr:Receptor-like protein kinase FERONIA [Morella rubra]
MPKVIISPFDYLCRRFSLDEIKRATADFHENLIIGRGGFGNVYRGLIDEGSTTVAIKHLHPESKQGYREFLSEIETVSQLRCVHIVSLIGYCYDDNEMILVYDYIANGTLRDQLYGTDNAPLPWKQRLQICVGAARGLHYLHTGAKHPIIHRDIKTTNILLDEKWVAKICDFGLSKQILDNTAASYVVEGTRGFSNAVDLEESGVSTRVMGTWGYLDPEYARRQRLTETSDVYSFGAVLWEVLCARKPIDTKLADEQRHLNHWARKCLERGIIGEIIDPCLKGTIAPESFKIYVEVAEGCARDSGIQRPTMNDVLEKLDFALELQKNADAENEKTNPDYERSYPELLSFHFAGSSGSAAEDASAHTRHMSESDYSGSIYTSHDTITGDFSGRSS